MEDISFFKPFIKHLAEESGKIIKSYFRTSVSIDFKDDKSPVTIADKKAEEIMRNLIQKEFPLHGILGEEFGSVNPDSEYQWILDPIDGTKSFISGAVTFGTLIALTKKNKPLLGVINQPILNEFMIGNNEYTELNGNKVKVRECNSLSNAVVLTTDYLNIRKYKNIDSFNRLIERAKFFRMWGDCYGYYLIASGFADVMIDPKMSVWDSMALIPIIRGAGGIITDYEGNDPVAGDSIIASVPELHKEVINILNT